MKSLFMFPFDVHLLTLIYSVLPKLRTISFAAYLIADPLLATVYSFLPTSSVTKSHQANHIISYRCSKFFMFSIFCIIWKISFHPKCMLSTEFISCPLSHSPQSCILPELLGVFFKSTVLTCSLNFIRKLYFLDTLIAVTCFVKLWNLPRR